MLLCFKKLANIWLNIVLCIKKELASKFNSKFLHTWKCFLSLKSKKKSDRPILESLFWRFLELLWRLAFSLRSWSLSWSSVMMLVSNWLFCFMRSLYLLWSCWVSTDSVWLSQLTTDTSVHSWKVTVNLRNQKCHNHRTTVCHKYSPPLTFLYIVLELKTN